MNGAAEPLPTVSALLQATRLDALDARVLLCHVMHWQRTQLITRADQRMTPEHLATFRALEARRHDGEPVAQLVGEREFYGRRFIVSPAVLIPRPDTELLVELALAAIDGSGNPACRVLDLGTGSGAIAVTLAAERPAARISATDISFEALAVAGANAEALLPAANTRAGGPVRFMSGSWFGALRDSGHDSQYDADNGNNEQGTAPFDLIVSNPPYIAANDSHLQQGDLRFEPRGALTDGGDGLSDLRLIIAQAGAWLNPGGALIVEHGYDQGQAVRTLFLAAGFTAVRTDRDLGGNERVTLGAKLLRPA